MQGFLIGLIEGALIGMLAKKYLLGGSFSVLGYLVSFIIPINEAVNLILLLIVFLLGVLALKNLKVDPTWTSFGLVIGAAIFFF